MKPITIGEIIKMSKEELQKINFHSTKINDENISSKDNSGFPPGIGENSDGVFGNEKTPKVFFSQGLDEALKMVNRCLRLIVFSIENRMNENGREGMKILGIEDYYKEVAEVFENISRNELEVENITSETKNNLFLIAKKKFEDMTYYIFDLNGCTRDEYEDLSGTDKAEVDYLMDDYDEDPHSNTYKKMAKYNMHTISGKGVSADKVHRIVRNDGSKMNAFDIIMRLCQKYKQFNPNEPFPYIMNADGSGDNWLEGFYQQYIREIIGTKSINSLTQESIDGLPDLTTLDDIERDQITQEREFIEHREGQSNSQNIGE